MCCFCIYSVDVLTNALSKLSNDMPKFKCQSLCIAIYYVFVCLDIFDVIAVGGLNLPTYSNRKH